MSYLCPFCDHGQFFKGQHSPKDPCTAPDWFRQIRDAAVSRGIPFHFKQWGEYGSDLIRIGKRRAGCELDGKEWKEFPVRGGL
jgi:protein gp37